MSDIKLYRMAGSDVAELAGGAMALEKSLQTVFERNLETLLGVRFLASEFPTTRYETVPPTVGFRSSNRAEIRTAEK